MRGLAVLLRSLGRTVDTVPGQELTRLDSHRGRTTPWLIAHPACALANLPPSSRPHLAQPALCRDQEGRSLMPESFPSLRPALSVALLPGGGLPDRRQTGWQTSRWVHNFARLALDRRCPGGSAAQEVPGCTGAVVEDPKSLRLSHPPWTAQLARSWRAARPAVAPHPPRILTPATVFPYKSNSIAQLCPPPSRDLNPSSSIQRASRLFWSPIPAFGVPLLQPAPLRCKAPSLNLHSHHPSPLSVWSRISGVGISVRLWSNWHIPNSRRRHRILFPILSDVLLSLTTRFIDSAASRWPLTINFSILKVFFFFGRPLRPHGRSAPPILRTPSARATQSRHVD